MFSIIYEFNTKPGFEDRFKVAWLQLTKSIYHLSGSLGSRLHTAKEPHKFIGYAQWPNKKAWEKDSNIENNGFLEARTKMRECLVGIETVYEMEVVEDYLQDKIFSV